MDATDISGAASQPANAAKVVIQLFQQGRPHAMPVWHEAAAVQHFNKFQGSLGLGPRAEDSLLAAVMSVSSTLSEPNGLQELSKRVFEKWGEIRSTLSDEEMLCAAATHRKVQICFFDLDKEQPVCETYPLLAQNHFRVLIGQSDRKSAPGHLGQLFWV
ncbi:TPA: hypothetical protein ACH3X2_000666 [Trebouxia sp. C0005]